MTFIASTDPALDIIPSETKSNKLVLGKDNFERLVRGVPDENIIAKSTSAIGIYDPSHALENTSGLRFETADRTILADKSSFQSHNGRLSFASNQYSDPVVKISNSTEKTINVKTIGQQEPKKMAGQQDSKIIINKNEQKAFSTYVLSYIDTRSSGVEINTEEAIAHDGRFQSTEKKLNPEHSSNFSVDHKDISIPGPASEQMTAGKNERNRETHIGLSYMRTFYEKLKITVFGANERTVVVRDYYSDEEYSVADFQKRVGSDMIPIKKLIRNGKEV